MPFRALDKENNSKISYELTPSEYRQEWRCPYCPSKFSFVNTQTKTKHFRHLVKGTYHTEPETKEHLELKRYIYENLKVKYRVEYEYKIGDRIIDVVVFLNEENMIGIECQVSSISLNEVEERNKNYESNNTFPIWILYPKYYLRKQLDNFKYYRLKIIERELRNSKWLFYYDPKLEILRRNMFEAKYVESDFVIYSDDYNTYYADDYECETIFSISDFEIFTPIELVDEACKYLNLYSKTRSDMELDNGRELTRQDLELEE